MEEIRRQRPVGFRLAAAVVVVQAVVAFVGFRPAFAYQYLVCILFSCIYVYGFCIGRNWARLAVILISTISLLLLCLDIRKQQSIKQIRDIILSPLAIYMLCWLNTRTVRDYFNSESAPPMP